MGRLHLFEFNDQSWLPTTLRNHLTGLLQVLLEVGFRSPRVANPLVDLVCRGVRAASVPGVVDLCSGASGPWVPLQPAVTRALGQPVPVLLTDLFPHTAAWSRSALRSEGAVVGHPEPFDAMQGSPDQPGLRTMFDAVHHFRPPQVRAILGAAVRDGEPVLTYEAPARHPLQLLHMILIFPVVALLLTPFIRPFDWRWIPLFPLCLFVVTFDGIVSCLRCYTADELTALAEAADPTGSFAWETGTVVPLGAGGVYLLGVPAGPGPIRSPSV